MSSSALPSNNNGVSKARVWLHAIFHSLTCSSEPCARYMCQLSKQRVQHILSCGGCELPSCRLLRKLLFHYIECKAATCTICVPVLSMLRSEESSAVHQAELDYLKQNGSSLQGLRPSASDPQAGSGAELFQDMIAAAASRPAGTGAATALDPAGTGAATASQPAAATAASATAAAAAAAATDAAIARAAAGSSALPSPHPSSRSLDSSPPSDSTVSSVPFTSGSHRRLVALGQQLLYTLMSKGDFQIPPQPDAQPPTAESATADAQPPAEPGSGGGEEGHSRQSPEWLQLVRHVLVECDPRGSCSNMRCMTSRRLLQHRAGCMDPTCFLCISTCNAFVRQPEGCGVLWPWERQEGSKDIEAAGFEELARALLQLDVEETQPAEGQQGGQQEE